MTLARMVQRRGDASVLASLNPVLMDGEFGLAKDTKKLKFGDGTTPWNELDYINGTAAVGVLNAPAADGESNFSKTVGTLDSVDEARVTMLRDELIRGALLIDVNGTISVVTDISSGVVQALTVAGGLGDTATVLQADETKFIVSHVDVRTPGSGYAVDDAVTVTSGGETAIPMTVTAVNESGGIEALSFDGSVVYETGNPAGAALAVTGGSGTGAEVNIVTRYAEGFQVVEGHLRYVPDADPLVQASRLRAYIAQTLLSRFPVGTDGLADGAVTADKIAGDAIYGGLNISVSKTEMGIEISVIGESDDDPDSQGTTVVRLIITDQDDNPIPNVIVYVNELGDQALKPVKTSAEGQGVFGAFGNAAYEIRVRDRSPFSAGPLDWEHFYLAPEATSIEDTKQDVTTEAPGTPTEATLKYLKYPNYASERRWKKLLEMVGDHGDVAYSASGISSLGSNLGNYTNGVLAPNGKIYAAPSGATNVLEIDPIARTISTFGSVGSEFTSNACAILGLNGKIYTIPWNSTAVLEIDPIARTVSTFGNLGAGNDKYGGARVAPNGKIYGIPYTATNVLEIDPIARTISTFGSVGSGGAKWYGSVLGPNGKIYGMPGLNSAVLEIDPIARTVSTFGNLGSTSYIKYSGGVLAPNGKIYAVPRGVTSVLEIDPVAKSVSTFGSVGSGQDTYNGAILGANGKGYVTPIKVGLPFLEIDLVAKTIASLGNAVSVVFQYSGGVLAPNGEIYLPPGNGGSVLVLAPDGGDLDLPLEPLLGTWNNGI